MFKRHKHPLPTFPPGIREKFYDLCEQLDENDVAILRAELNKFAADSLTKKNVRYDKDSVKLLYERAVMLLDSYPQMDSKQQELVIGAIRYFAISEDLVSEDVFSTGLNDDIKIMNYVLEQLGFANHAIPLSS